LYRHFPTREALIEAAYRNELAKLCDSAPELLRTKPADEALRAWLDGFVDYMATKHGMGDALKAVIASGVNPFEQSRAKLGEAMTVLLTAAVEAGAIRADMDPWDVILSGSGVCMVFSQVGDREQAGRMLDLLMDGLRYGAGNH
ncbi:TetR/AcrR family transcriptional regulator, partial [Kibdelosporangium lantanae]